MENRDNDGNGFGCVVIIFLLVCAFLAGVHDNAPWLGWNLIFWEDGSGM